MPRFKRWMEEHDGHIIRFEMSEHDNWPGDPQRRKWTRHDWGFAITASIYIGIFIAAFVRALFA